VLPPVNASVPKVVKANYVYAITGLDRHVAHTLAETRVLSTPVGTVFFLRPNQPKYSYAVTLVGILNPPDEVRLELPIQSYAHTLTHV
jgi:hypothetical protein